MFEPNTAVLVPPDWGGGVSMWVGQNGLCAVKPKSETQPVTLGIKLHKMTTHMCDAHCVWERPTVLEENGLG